MSNRLTYPFIKIDIVAMKESVGIFFDGVSKTFSGCSIELDKIAEQLDYKVENSIPEYEKEELKKKFLQYCKQSNNNYFTVRELRHICCCISDIIDFNNSETIFQLSQFKKLIDSNWRDAFLCGLVLFMFRKWDILNKYSEFHNFILQKVKDYKGKRRLIVQINKYINYFSLSGPSELGRYLRKISKTFLFSAEMFGFRKAKISCSYFQGVLLSYYSEAEHIDEYFEECLKLCNNGNTIKRTLAHLIVDINAKKEMPQWENKKEKLKLLAIKHIGYPEQKDKWDFLSGVPDNAREEIKKAREIVQLWITQKYIDVVFTKLMSDPSRAFFWKHYAGSIDFFQVVGAPWAKNEVEKSLGYTDSSNHFRQTNDWPCAFILRIKGRYIIEFAEAPNALYVYDQETWDTLRWKNIAGLKITSLPYLIKEKEYIYRDIGKLFHIGEWQRRMYDWLRIKLSVYMDR